MNIASKNLPWNLYFYEFKEIIREMEFPLIRSRHIYYQMYGNYCEWVRKILCLEVKNYQCLQKKKLENWLKDMDMLY